MGLMSFIKSQFIEIIEWLDDTNYTLVWRFPDEDHEIKNGAKLVCRNGQACILVNEGKAADIFGPGMHTLSTENVPVLSRLRGWKYGFSSPYKAEVYFINLKQYLDQKWGTPKPVLVRDPEFAVGNRPGRVRIRAFGSYNFKIIDPRKFFDEVVGTQGFVSSDEIEGYVRSRLLSGFTKSAAKSELSVADMAAHYDVLGQAVLAGINEDLAGIGIALTAFVVENISLPAEVEKALDAAAAQSARGVDNTLAWEGMQAMRDAAKQPGGGTGAMQAGMGMGMGAGMGNMMAGMMGHAMPGYGYPPQPGYPPAPQHGYPPQQPHAPAPQHAQHPPAAAPASASSLEEKLIKLKAAFESNLLTEEEYKTKRAQLLADF